MEEENYTGDGSLDINKKPANRTTTGKWKACRFILGTECCERLAFYGLSANLVNYLRVRLNFPIAKAAATVSMWAGTCYMTPIIGAFLADAYLGRYWTIGSFSILYVLGVILLTMSASVPGLKPSCDAKGCTATTLQSALCFLALYMIAFGTGGIKPCVSSFGADQFDDTEETERKKKSSFFNWFFFTISMGALFASTFLVWTQINVGWGLGFGIPAATMTIAVVCFFSGSRRYRFIKPGGSPLTRIAQVIVASIRKFRVKVVDDKSLYDECHQIQGRKLEHTNKLRFLDKAAVQTENDVNRDGKINPWRLCTVNQVEELKSVIGMLPIWVTGIVFSIMFSQMSTLFILQGNTMDQHIGPKLKIPSASLSLFEILSVLSWTAVYDKLIVPCARKFTGHARGFTRLQRIGIGLAISIVSMVVAATFENFRLGFIRENNYYDLQTIPMSIFWLVPQYFLMGCAGVFVSVGHLEFFYEEAPDGMRSMCSALSLMGISLGSYLNSLLITVARGWIPDNLNRGHLNYFYWLSATIGVVNILLFLLAAKYYSYKKVVETNSTSLV